MKTLIKLLTVAALVTVIDSCKDKDFTLSKQTDSPPKTLRKVEMEEDYLTFDSETELSNTLNYFKTLKVNQLDEWEKSISFKSKRSQRDDTFPFPCLSTLLNDKGIVKVSQEFRMFSNNRIMFTRDKKYLNLSILSSSPIGKNEDFEIVEIEKSLPTINQRGARASRLADETGRDFCRTDGNIVTSRVYNTVQLACSYYKRGSGSPVNAAGCVTPYYYEIRFQVETRHYGQLTATPQPPRHYISYSASIIPFGNCSCNDGSMQNSSSCTLYSINPISPSYAGRSTSLEGPFHSISMFNGYVGASSVNAVKRTENRGVSVNISYDVGIDSDGMEFEDFSCSNPSYPPINLLFNP